MACLLELCQRNLTYGLVLILAKYENVFFYDVTNASTYTSPRSFIKIYPWVIRNAKRGIFHILNNSNGIYLVKPQLFLCLCCIFIPMVAIMWKTVFWIQTAAGMIFHNIRYRKQCCQLLVRHFPKEKQ